MNNTVEILTVTDEFNERCNNVDGVAIFSMTDEFDERRNNVDDKYRSNFSIR